MEKVEVLRARAERGLPLFDPRDAVDGPGTPPGEELRRPRSRGSSAALGRFGGRYEALRARRRRAAANARDRERVVA